MLNEGLDVVAEGRAIRVADDATLHHVAEAGRLVPGQ